MLQFSDIYKNQRTFILFSIENNNINTVFSALISLKERLKTGNSFNFLEKTNCAFIDVTAVDNIEKKQRFCLTYNFIKYYNSARLFLNTQLNAYTTIASLSSAFRGALTAEREVFDMFGIFFQDHAELRRLLTDYSFVGNPLKKDFPLSGFVETKYSYVKKTLIFKPVSWHKNFADLNLEILGYKNNMKNLKEQIIRDVLIHV